MTLTENNFCNCKTCDITLLCDNKAKLYQTLKLIQNTVRIQSSLYTANLGPLSAYSKPTKVNHNVCWNQMSDRPVPSVQRATVPTGFYHSLNSRHHSVTSSRPGCQTPGGIGCDIKHNSYDRYLNRLKGKGPLKQGIVSPYFGNPIPFNPAYPIYGGKTIKTNIVSGCNCCLQEKKCDVIPPCQIPYVYYTYIFNLGDNVYAIKDGTDYYSEATIVNIENDIYTIEFKDGASEKITYAKLYYYDYHYLNKQ